MNPRNPGNEGESKQEDEYVFLFFGVTGASPAAVRGGLGAGWVEQGAPLCCEQFTDLAVQVGLEMPLFAK